MQTLTQSDTASHDTYGVVYRGKPLTTLFFVLLVVVGIWLLLKRRRKL